MMGKDEFIFSYSEAFVLRIPTRANDLSVNRRMFLLECFFVRNKKEHYLHLSYIFSCNISSGIIIIIDDIYQPS
jgi:hypothetical protein